MYPAAAPHHQSIYDNAADSREYRPWSFIRTLQFRFFSAQFPEGNESDDIAPEQGADIDLSNECDGVGQDQQERNDTYC